MKYKNIRELEIIFHIAFWVIYFFYPVMEKGWEDHYHFDVEKEGIELLFISSSVYLAYFIFKKVSNRTFVILVWVILMLLMVYVSCYWSVISCMYCSIRICFFSRLAEYLFVNIFFLAFWGFKKNIMNQRALEKSERNRINAELNGLKAQVNPHFLFNTLNMLYSNALLKDEGLPDKILKLSDNLHYMLHEGGKNRVELSKEITFIEDYISLQKARLADKIEINFKSTTDDLSQKIPPLLLIPFIENAFKYSSVAKGKKIPLIIDIKLKEKKLHLYVENQYDSKYSDNQETIWKSSGIGLTNTKKRLTLLYPEAHELIIATENNIFKVTLTVDLMDK
ncbi:sensor histidine kinase [Aquimarina hainanensis]|uniref:Sensor histidine kinase n=1 Tax=Aquimarina hainanensis TaxID=1578017 RepID=A0ABW5N9Z1_9FLAO